MAKKGNGMQSKSKAAVAEAESRSLTLAQRGPRNLMEIAEFSLAIACDVVRGAMSASAANAASSNTGKTLKSIEMQLKYGPKGSGNAMLVAPK